MASHEAEGEGSGHLLPGTRLTIVKLRPDGTEAARYPGKVIPSRQDWVAVRAVWERGRVDLGYLVFERGDIVREYFALTQPFNAMALYRPDGTFKGWYCNVTHPSWVEDSCLFWHDLYVDVIVYPDGRTLVLDEDELEQAGLAEQDPATHRMIVEARDHLLRMARERAYPFSEAP